MKKTLLFLIFFLQFLIISAQNSTDVLQSFGLHPGFTGTINSTVIQPDGKIIVGGSFKLFQGIEEKNFIRLNADGSKDTSFQINNLFENHTVNSIILQPDGKIIVGHDHGLIRLNTDGTKDTSFDLGNGFYAFENYGCINSLVLQPDGKIIAVGAFIEFQGITQQHIIRLNPDGSKDSSFNIGTGFTGNVMPYLYSVVLQSDGKIIVAGIYQNYQNINRGSIVRLNTDGSIDTTFDTIFTSLDRIKSLALQSDGKILVACYNSIPNRGLLRLNTDGSKDTSFNIGSNGFNDEVNCVSIQPDGKILVGGKFSSYNTTRQRSIIRLNSDGSKDFSFDIGTGLIKLDTSIVPLAVNSFSLLSDGKIIAGGDFNSYQDTTKNNIVRLNDNGSIDKSFDTGRGLDDAVLAIASQSDKKFIVAGSFTSYDGIPQNRIIRFNADGTKDKTFNIGKGFDDTVNCLLIQPDGKTLIGGKSGLLTRINSDGAPDVSFSRLAFESSSKLYFEIYIKALALQDDGKIIVGGNFGKYGGLSQEYLVRLNANGSKDDSFNIGKGFDGTVNSVLVQPDGKIIVGGNFSFYQTLSITHGLIRLNPDGSKDNTFVPDVYLGAVYCMKLQPDGKIIIGGKGGYFVRLNADGSKDTSFNTGNGFDYDILSMYLQQDGKILVGGRFVNYQDFESNRIIRLNADGSRDTSFDIGSGFTRNRYSNLIEDNSVSAIEVQSDGVIIAGGQFGKYKDVRSSYLVTLNGTYIASPLTAEASQINVPCSGGATGSASVSVTGGKRPYSYLWSNNATTSTITGLTPGNYSCEITDANLTKITKNFTITTDLDTEIPTITAPLAVTVNATSDCEVRNIVLGTPLTFDNCSVVSVTNNAPLAFPVGITWVTWTVKDASNNMAQASQLVTVKDITVPIITAPPTLTLNLEQSCLIYMPNLVNPVTTDCSFVTIKNNAPVFFPLGETKVTWTARDANANIATAVQTVIVKDITPPAIETPAAITIDSNCKAATVVLVEPKTSDNCSVASVTNDAPAIFPIGDTTVTWTVKDKSNNTSTAAQIVTVKGLTATITNNAGILTAVESEATYKWLECNSGTFIAIPNESNVSFTPKKPGSYAVEITKNGCSVTSTCYEVKTLGTKDFDLENSLKLYPNPTKDFVTIEINAIDNAKLKIFDVSGKFILSKELKTTSNTINIAHLTSGVYLFEISNDNGKTIKKVIKK
ncbi:T9SS type A sorting domain-containing protein [Flavobacterium pectinovorum]|uniref:T9SS C-terminal target domain-containing protein n=1 Tax=Flavobacterium pectinovorum TaxID=29533 RepID=A0A502F681_9FLAO|nr:T9SS type A sorting domain-containing protein [Flavobacterium pectinovorum]TPG44679.1 T9SS C-terminal target domain-containing protein [Flavobacterium pectinovorum]